MSISAQASMITVTSRPKRQIQQAQLNILPDRAGCDKQHEDDTNITCIFSGISQDKIYLQ